MGVTGTGGITTGAPTRQQKHSEINEAINYLEGKINGLGFLASKIRGEKSSTEKDAEKLRESDSLESILNGAAGRIRGLSDVAQEIIRDIEEMLF